MPFAHVILLLQSQKNGANSDLDQSIRIRLKLCYLWIFFDIFRPIGSFSPFPILFPWSKKDSVNNSGDEWVVCARNLLSSVVCAQNLLCSVGSDGQGY